MPRGWGGGIPFPFTPPSKKKIDSPKPLLLQVSSNQHSTKMDSKYATAAIIARGIVATKHNVSIDSVYIPPAMVKKVLDNAMKYGIEIDEVAKGVFAMDTTKHITGLQIEKKDRSKPRWAGTISPHIQQQHDLGITPSYNSGGGCRHITNELTGQVQSIIAPDTPPDEISRFRHNARLLENKQKTINRLRAKLAAKKTK